MKKIAIISQFNRHNTNYGNRLQAFALYNYLSETYSELDVEYLYFDFFDKMKITKKNTISEEFKRVLNGIFKHILPSKKQYKGIKNRWIACDEFSCRNMNLRKCSYTWEELVSSDFDAIIVGSDVVWAQRKNKIARIRFLDFETLKPFKRISYAASFGRDWIPAENRDSIKQFLSKFQAVSVRESSSIELLAELGISAVHTLDPTLLLSAEEWENYEVPIKCSNDNYEMLVKQGKYVFAYLLGDDLKMRNAISEWAASKGLLVITIPYATGNKNYVDKKFGDIKIWDCSPGNWLWLIHHSQYVITDSFHGSVFSTIFEKKFIVLERKMEVNINNRMIDYLATIKQSNKMISYKDLDQVDNWEWDYYLIKENIDVKKHFSEKYIRNAIENI